MIYPVRVVGTTISLMVIVPPTLPPDRRGTGVT